MARDVYKLTNEEMKSIIIAWLKDNQNRLDVYITKEGSAYLNGFIQANGNINFVNGDIHNDLLKKYKNLITDYEELHNENKELKLANRFINWIYKLIHYTFYFKK